MSKILEKERVAYFDIDMTIVIWHNPDNENEDPDDFIELERNEVKLLGRINAKIVRKMKAHKFWGDGVVVWSNSGALFAKYICEQFNLDDLVDVYLTKPFVYYDDLKCTEFMDKHRYEI